MDGFDAVVLAGGGARRMGGADKAGIDIAGRSLLDRVVAACSGAGRIVVVGPSRPTEVEVAWARERPPGGGPAAGLATGLELVAADIVAVLAADLPYLEASHVAGLVAAIGDHDGVVLCDAAGREQPLAGAYRTGALRARIGELGDTQGASIGSLTAGLDLARIADDRAVRDCDTWDDVARARKALKGGDPHVRTMDR